MKIIPQNGMILVTYLGRGETTTEAGIIIGEKIEPPSQMEVVTCRVEAIDTEDKETNLIVGQIVMVTVMSLKPLADVSSSSNRGFIRWADVIAVIEEENEDAN